MNENLRKCRDCGGKVSKRATTCPHCGAPQEILKESEEEITEVKHEKENRSIRGHIYIIIWGFLAGIGGFCFLIILLMGTNFFASQENDTTPRQMFMIQNLSQNEILQFTNDRLEDRNSTVLALSICGSIFLGLGYIAEGITNKNRNLRNRKKIFNPVLFGIIVGYLTFIYPIIVEILAFSRAMSSQAYEKEIRLHTLKNLLDTDIIYFNTVIVPIFAIISALFVFAILNRKKGV